MKSKFLLFLVAIVFAFAGQVGAQCTPDSSVIASGTPFEPLPLSSLAGGTIGSSYSDQITVYQPDTLEFNAADLGIPLPLPPFSLPVNSVTYTLSGLPAGLTASCSPSSSCVWNVNDIGCIGITGTPTEGGTFDFTASALYNVEIDAATSALTGGLIPAGPFTLPAGIPYSWSMDIPTSVDEDLDPNAFQLSQNVPNPTEGMTKVFFTVPSPANVEFEVYSIIGAKVFSSTFSAKTGLNDLEFDASNLDAGIYFYSVTKEDVTLTKRMLVVK